MTFHPPLLIRRCWPLAAAVLLGVVSAYPASGQTRELTLQQAVEMALTGNRDIGNARTEIRRSDAAVSEAYGNALPTLSLSGSYVRNIQKQVFYFPGNDGVTRPIEIGSDNAITTDLKLSQIVFNAAVLTGVGTAKTYAMMSREQLRSTATTTVLSVQKAYYGALLMREVLALNERVLENAEQNASIARRFYEQGLRAEFDAIRADVQAANQRPAVVQSRDNLALALQGMKILLDLPPGTDLSVSGELMPPGPEDSIEVSVAELVAPLSERNPQLAVARLGTEMASDIVDIYRAEYLPTVVLFGTYSLGAQADEFSALDFKPTSMVGLSLSVNLFNGLQSTSRVEQAGFELEKARSQVAQLDNALRLQLESIVRRIKYARERLAVSEGTVAQAERAYNIATVSYRAGTGTQYQINDADVARAASRLNRLNAIYDYRVARAELDALLGNTVVLNGDAVQLTVSR